MNSNESFSIEEAIAAQRELRKRLGLGDERLSSEALISMLHDEIAKMRASGHSDGEIAATIEHATGKSVSPDAVGRLYAAGGKRG